jgi:hypothetical protein
MAKLGELYEQDFVLWTEQQAAGLRRAEGSNLPLDWENLAEEIESLGRSDRRGLRSQIRRVLRHLLKLESFPAENPRAGRRASINESRKELRDLLRDSPSLKTEVDESIGEEISLAAELAAADLAERGEPADAAWARLGQGGFTAEQVLGDWFPPIPG